MALKDKIDQANNSEYAKKSSGWFKAKEGTNQMRILTEPEIIFEDYYKGICYHQCGFEGSPKYLTRILDRTDGQVKLYKMPFKVFETISSFEEDTELEFSSFPMPYDVKINAKGAGSKEVKYTVMPSLKRDLVPQETLDLLRAQKSIPEIIKLLQDKNIEKHKQDGTWQKEQDRLAQLAEDLKSGSGGTGVDSIEYPDEDIAPEDIPF